MKRIDNLYERVCKERINIGRINIGSEIDFKMPDKSIARGKVQYISNNSIEVKVGFKNDTILIHPKDVVKIIEESLSTKSVCKEGIIYRKSINDAKKYLDAVIKKGDLKGYKNVRYYTGNKLDKKIGDQYAIEFDAIYPESFEESSTSDKIMKYYLAVKNNKLTDDIVDDVNKILPTRIANDILQKAKSMSQSDINRIIMQYGMGKESLSRLDTLHESVCKESESGIWYDDVEKIVEEVGKKVNYSSSDKLWSDLNKILYSVRNQKGSRDMGLSNKEVQTLKQAIKKYNIRGIHSDALKESLSEGLSQQEKDKLWNNTPKDYKSIINGKKHIQVRTNKGSTLKPIDNITNDEYKQIVKESLSPLDRLYESVCKEAQRYGNVRGRNVYIMDKVKAKPGFLAVQDLKTGQAYEIPEKEVKNISTKYPEKIEIESLSPLDRLYESVK